MAAYLPCQVLNDRIGLVSGKAGLWILSLHREIVEACKTFNKTVFYVHGDADELIRHALQIVEKAGLSRCGIPAFNHWSGSCREGGLLTALATARTVPMMADLRVVVIKDVHLGDDEGLAALVGYLEKPVDTTLLILTAGKFPAVKKGGTQWSRKIAKCVKVVGHDFSYSASKIRPQSFAMERARSMGKMLGSREADVLVSAVGTGLSTLAREVEKLCLYVGDQERIEARDVGEACAILAEEGLWELTSGLAEGNGERALRSLHRRLEEGVAPHQLIGQVCWQVRVLLVAREALDAGVPEGAIQKKHRVRAPTLRALKTPSGARFKRPAIVLARLARANRAMNEHRAGGRRILESLILDLCC